MTAQRALATLLPAMEPQLQTPVFVFCTLKTLPAEALEASPVGLFYEVEGITLIVPKAAAIARGWPYTYECRQITLTVHSSLEAVGFLAAITQALAAEQISVNAMSAYYHDHLFVPAEKAEQAFSCLQQLSTSASAQRESNQV